MYTIELWNEFETWVSVRTVGAYGANSYSVLVPTLQNNDTTYFRLIANMDEGNFLTSEEVAGVAIDNILPGTPENIFVSHEEDYINLTWDYAPDIDFSYLQASEIWDSPIYTIENSAAFMIADDPHPYNEFFINSVDINDNLSENSEYISAHSLKEGYNLVSFSVLPSQPYSALGFVIPGTGSESPIIGIIGEGVAASYIYTDSFGNNNYGWFGSLIYLSPNAGYWILCTSDNVVVVQGSKEKDSNFTLHSGSNLISYKCSTPGVLNELLIQNENECGIEGILGQGVATYYLNGDWIGSLNELLPGSGYWFNVDNVDNDGNECGTMTLNYDCPEESPELIRVAVNNTDTPQFTQSTQQAFYFIEKIENAEEGDIVEAYNGSTLVGSRIWNGAFTDIPVMGEDHSDFTSGFSKMGSIPTFKLVKENGEVFEIAGDIPSWESNGLFIVESMSIREIAPEKYSLASVYPNPFNPSTTVSFTIPELSVVTINVFDITGRKITELMNGSMAAGYHNLTWNAGNQSSGIYFVKMIARSSIGEVNGEFIQTQKLILAK